MGNYQKYRGNPENKLFYLLNNFMGGINTEFSDDSSNDTDFESIINFDMDKLGTLNKRGGFGELNAISEIFNKLDIENELPNIKNRTVSNPNPENENDNVVYMKLLRNDNNCFRALSAFSGEDAYRQYQQMYGFQENRFTLLMITTSLVDGVENSSKAWLYQCYLPDLIYDGSGVPTDTDTMTISCCKTNLPITFKWDRNLMNLETIEYYDKIYFTGNDECLMVFDRSTTISTDADLASAFTYSGSNITEVTYTCNGTETGEYYFVYDSTNYQFTMPTVESGDMLVFDGTTLKKDDTTIHTTTNNTGTLLTMTGVSNSAYVPSGLEVRHVGFNVLCNDPMHSINTQGLSTDSIQGIYISTSNNIPLLALPLGQSFLLNIIYTGTDNGFAIEMKEGDNNLSFEILANTTLSQTGLKVYEVKFKDAPNGEVEIKITKNGATIEPYYDYYNVEQVDAEAKVVEQLNVGDYGLCEMYNRAVYYKNDTIWFSEINNFNYIPNYNYVTLPLEPTDKITKICYFKKSYIIFTKQKIYKMTGSFGTSDFAVSPVNTSLGCHAGNTVVPIEDTLYFSSPRGLFALRSSQFVEGFENVKELDLKVKKLTSDFTKYSDELSNPAVRFNGVSERAYATRYKDKYLLFYNNYNDKGDYAAVNDLDVLAYQFDIGAYTTYRFKEKPTFLFMVDNAIETLATVAQKQIYSEEETVLEYDFSQSDGVTVEDTSGNDRDGIVRGEVTVNKGAGINMNGNNSYAKMNGFGENIEDGFNITLDTKSTTLNGATLINLQQASKTASSVVDSISTNTANDYKAVLNYTITPNTATNSDTVSYKLTYYRYNNAVATGSLTYSLGSLIPSKTVNFDLTGVNSAVVDSGTFKIIRDSSGRYSSIWYLTVNSTYVVTTTTTSQVLGADVNLTSKFYDAKTNDGTSISWIKLGFSSFKATATETGCKITYTPAVKHTARLNIGSRTLHVTIDGTEYNHTISKISSPSGTTKGSAKTINLTYSETKTITVKMKFDIKFTWQSKDKYVSSISLKKNPTIDMPSISTITNTTTTTKDFTLTANKSIKLAPNYESFREIILKQNGNADQLLFKLTTENGEFTLLSDTGVGLTSRHTWKIDIGKTSSGYTCSLYKDGKVLKSKAVPENMVITANRNACYLGTDNNRTIFFNGDIYSVNITSPSKTLLEYTFPEGQGTVTYDSSGNRTPAVLYGGTTWIIESGMIFGGNAYVEIPTLDENVYFKNGFKIEFEGIIGGNDRTVKIIDLATSYNNDTAKNKKCSINISVKNNVLEFNSTSLEYISYKLQDTTTNLSVNHKYTIDCVDDGESGYELSLYVDDVIKAAAEFKYGGVTNIRRLSNLIGKSNTTTDPLFKGILKNLKIITYASLSPIVQYRSALYEFDTTSTDFGKPIYIELRTKGVNMKYPQHMKKLKHIFVKAIGGYSYGEMFFTLYGDGYIVNDPKIYNYYIDERGTVVQEYHEIKDLKIDERVSILGNMRLDYTKLGSGMYQTRKLIIPKKAKNFSILTFGESSDYISIESIGYVCKLGKVKEG